MCIIISSKIHRQKATLPPKRHRIGAPAKGRCYSRDTFRGRDEIKLVYFAMEHLVRSCTNLAPIDVQATKQRTWIAAHTVTQIFGRELPSSSLFARRKLRHSPGPRIIAQESCHGPCQEDKIDGAAVQKTDWHFLRASQGKHMIWR